MQNKLIFFLILILGSLLFAQTPEEEYFVGVKDGVYINEKMSIQIQNFEKDFELRHLVKESYLGVFDDFCEIILKKDKSKIGEIQIGKDSRSRRVDPYLDEELGGIKVAQSVLHENPWVKNQKGMYYLFYFENELMKSGIKVGQVIIHKDYREWVKKNLTFLLK